MKKMQVMLFLLLLLSGVCAETTEFFIEPTFMEVYPGETFQCEASETENISWQSSDPTVAEVDENGLITAKTPGSATVSAECGDSIKTVNVIVEQDVLSIAFDRDTLYLLTGEEGDLSEYILWNDGRSTPEDVSTRWYVEDSSVISVEETGKYRSLKPGSTRVYVYSYNTLRAVLQVNVTRKESKLNLDKDKITLYVGEETEIEAVIADMKPEDTFAWKIEEGETVATISDSQSLKTAITAMAAGETTLTAEYWDSEKQMTVTRVTEIVVQEAPVMPVVSCFGAKVDAATALRARCVGDVLHLDATVYADEAGEKIAEDQRVRWTSSDPEIAKVDEDTGDVTALAPGTAEITVVSVSDAAAKTTIRIEVPDTIAKICADAENITFSRGKFATVELYAQAGGTSVPVSGGIDIAIVEEDAPVTVECLKRGNGIHCVLKGKAEGKATLRATLYAEDARYTRVLDIPVTVTEGTGSETGVIMTAKVTLENAVIRETPDTKAAVLRRAARGEILAITGMEENGWFALQDGGYLPHYALSIVSVAAGSETEELSEEPKEDAVVIRETDATDRYGNSVGKICVGAKVVFNESGYCVLEDGTECAIDRNDLQEITKDTVQYRAMTLTGVTDTGVNLREGPSTSSDVLQMFPTRTTVTIQGALRNGFYPVQVGNSQSGYISARFLTITAEETVSDGYSSLLSTYGTPAALSLNVRSSASMNGEIIGTLHNAAYDTENTGRFTTTDTVKVLLCVDGEWYKVELPNGKWGYVTAEYCRISVR